jgi:hypothetical protein
MRPIIDVKPEHRAKLLELAARRGEKGFSSIIGEAVEEHLKQTVANEDARRRARLLRGRLSRKDVQALRQATAAVRDSWR